MRRKKGTVVPKKGTLVRKKCARKGDDIKYASMIAAALRKELGNTSGAIKTVMQWTGASERTVKYWFAGLRGPSGEHLSILAEHSDAVVSGFLNLSGREHDVATGKLFEARRKLTELGALFDDLVDTGG